MCSDRQSAHGILPHSYASGGGIACCHGAGGGDSQCHCSRREQPHSHRPQCYQPQRARTYGDGAVAAVPMAKIPLARNMPRPIFICTSGSPKSVRLLLYS